MAKKPARNKYSIDNLNRLAIKQGSDKLISPGRFSIDRDNNLIYWLNQPEAWRRIYGLPDKVVFIGKWRLNDNYDLELRLQNVTRHNERLILKGEVVSVNRDSLAFEVKNYDENGLLHIQILELNGVWQATEDNVLSFLVKKKELPDTLILKGGWSVNSNQQIIYTHEKVNLKTKVKTIKTVTFEGYWYIASATRLVYILSKSSASRFDFRCQIESPEIYPKQGEIRYRIGIGLIRKSYVNVCLYGVWKFNHKLGLSFQMDYGQGMIKSIEFGTDIYLSEKDKIKFYLTNLNKEPLGMNVIFSRRFLKNLDAEVLLRIKKAGEEKRIETGVSITF